MKITISGLPGSGKNLVGRTVAEKLGFKFYCMGDMRRDIAKEKGITLAELNKIGETEDWTDKEVDSYQEKIGKEQDNFVMVGRTSYYFIPDSVKVFLDVEAEEGAKRAMSDTSNPERAVEPFKDLQDAIKVLKERKESDMKRYLKYYNTEVYNHNNYDLVIDTTNKTPEEVVEEILGFVQKEVIS